MAPRLVDGTHRCARANAWRLVVLSCMLLPVAACSTPAAPAQHADPFYVAPAAPHDGGGAPSLNAGPRGGGGAHGGGVGTGNGAGLQDPGLSTPGMPAASGSMSLGTGQGL